MAKSQDAFRTISEVADWLETPAHVLRFWESRFTQVKPVKRAGGRRYYRPADMELLSGIKKLLHEDGMTIKGVQKLLRAEGIKHVAAMSQSLGELAPADDQKAQKPLSDALKIGTPIKDDTLEGKVISFPPVVEDVSEEETAPEISEQPDALEPKVPLQASFLDDVSENSEAPDPILEPFQPSDSVPEIDASLPPELVDAEPEAAPLETAAEERALDAPTEPPLSSELSEPIAETISTDAPLSDEQIQNVDLPEVGIEEDEPNESPEYETEKAQSDAEITSVAELVLPDASEVPEVGNSFPSTTLETSEMADSDDTEQPEDVALEEDVTSENFLEEIAENVEESFAQEEEPDAEITPEEAGLEQIPEQELQTPVDRLPMEELAPDETFATEPLDDLNTTSDPAPHFVEPNEKLAVAETVHQSTADEEPATAPDIPEIEDIPSPNLEPEDLPTEEAIPLLSQALDDPEDDSSKLVASTIRANIWRRAAPFSPDKKSELAEVTARLVALRKSYGIVSKPSPEN